MSVYVFRHYRGVSSTMMHIGKMAKCVAQTYTLVDINCLHWRWFVHRLTRRDLLGSTVIYFSWSQCHKYEDVCQSHGPLPWLSQKASSSTRMSALKISVSNPLARLFCRMSNCGVPLRIITIIYLCKLKQQVPYQYTIWDACGLARSNL